MRVIITAVVELEGDMSEDGLLEKTFDVIEGETTYFLRYCLSEDTNGFDTLPSDIRISNVESVEVEA